MTNAHKIVKDMIGHNDKTRVVWQVRSSRTDTPVPNGRFYNWREADDLREKLGKDTHHIVQFTEG